MAIRVLLVDDYVFIREALRALLTAQAGIEVVAEAEDGPSAVRLASELSPDIVVMDVRLPELSGLEATRQIRLARPETRVVLLSAAKEKESESRALEAGASSFLRKDTAFERLVPAIRAALSSTVLRAG